MRITTRVSIGLFIICALLITSVTYQLSQVEALQSVNQDVSEITIEGARVSLRLLQALDGVQEFAAKYQVIPGDSVYETQWRESERAVGTNLRALDALALAGPELEILKKIESGWDQYLEISPMMATETVSLLPGVVFPQISAIVADLRADVETLIAMNETVVDEQMLASSRATQRARRFAWASGGSALLVAAIMSFLLYRSISGPLRRLTKGTREIARGRFDHRLRIQGPRELSSLAKDFDRMAARLDELENLKRDFVSHVSHELKTPLAAIRETIEVLLDGIPGPLTEKQARLLDLSRSSSDRLSSMISDLLETSRLEAGATGYVTARYDLADMIRSVLDEMEPLAVERGLEIYLRIDAEVPDLVCDRNRMREVLVNLVSNAVKFSPEGGRVRLVVSELDEIVPGCPSNRRIVRGESGPFLMLSVWDQGPGVPDRDKDGIFEKFHQVRGGERLRGQGVGLGLAIAWRIVEAHGGAVWVEDARDGGSVFRMLLPRVSSRWAGAFDTTRIGVPTEEKEAAEDETVEGEAAPSPALEPSLARSSVRSRVALGALAALLSAGCAIATPEIEEIVPEPIPEPVSEAVVAPIVESPPELQIDPNEQRLATGWSFFSEGGYEAAYELFQEMLSPDGDSQLVGQAVWALALLYLEPEWERYDPNWSRTLLVHLETHFSHDALGMQARWARSLLADMTSVQQTIVEQEEALRALNETVDQLKNIDLNRAPAGTPNGGG